jgi:hypothetical protein
MAVRKLLLVKEEMTVKHEMLKNTNRHNPIIN